jgi:uncharacterized membrane protein
MDHEADRWIVTTRRRNALRLLGVGVALVVAGVGAYFAYRVPGVERSMIRAVAVGGSFAIVGAALIVAGAVLLGRAKRPVVARDDDWSGES